MNEIKFLCNPCSSIGDENPESLSTKNEWSLCDIGGKFFQRILPWNFRAPNFHMWRTIIELRMRGQDSSQNLDTEISKLNLWGNDIIDSIICIFISTFQEMFHENSKFHNFIFCPI